MHYSNGRKAVNGDRVMKVVPAGYWGKSVIGILHDAVPGNDHCNGNLAVPVADQPGCNLTECLHIDDVRAILGDIKLVPDTSKPVELCNGAGFGPVPMDPAEINPVKQVDTDKM